MADRISSTVEKTSSSIKQIADTTNMTKLVGGIIKEEIPKANEGTYSLLYIYDQYTN